MVQKIACLHSFVTVKTSSLTTYIITSPLSLHVRLNQTPWGPVRLLSEICTYKRYIRGEKKRVRIKWETQRGAQKWFSSNSIYHIYMIYSIYTIYYISYMIYTYMYIHIHTYILLDGLLETIAFLTIRTKDGKMGENKLQGSRSIVVN